MKSPPHSLIASERKGHIGDAAADLAAWADVLDDLCGPDEVHGIVVMLLHPRPDRQDVGVENNVLGIEAHLLHHYLVRSLANPDLYMQAFSQYPWNEDLTLQCSIGRSELALIG